MRPATPTWSAPLRAALVALACASSAGCADSRPLALPPPPIPPPACPGVHYATDVPAPAVDTTILFHERFGASTGSAASGVIVDIHDNQGTIGFDGHGPMPAFIYAIQPIPTNRDVTLFAGLGVEPGTWYPFWLYCDASGRLIRFYGEHTDAAGPFDANIDGTCTRTDAYWEMPVQLAANTLTSVAMTCGFDVTTPSGAPPVLTLPSSAPGSVDVWGGTATVLVFSTVDCRTGCGTDGTLELHSILWDHLLGNVGFVIWYLEAPETGLGVVAANSLLFPDATLWSAPFRNATWATPP